VNGALRWAPVVLALLVAGCGRCSDEPRVPFKLPKSNGQGSEPPPLPDVVAAGDAALGAARLFTPAVDRPSLGGAQLSLARVHAALERDLDGDGDSDVLALHEDDTHALHLSVSTREAGGFAAARELAPFSQPAPANCTVAAARIEALSSTKALSTVQRSCGEPRVASTPVSSLTLLSLEATPRLLERIDLLDVAATGGRPLALTVSSRDVDGDGHDDVAFTVRYADSPEGDALPLVWLDRPSGLVRDLREPEATLGAWAAAAQSLVAKVPDQALARAELGLSLERALCRELASAQIALSSSAGVPCGGVKSTASLLATVVAARAKKADLGGAFAAYRELRRGDPPPAQRILDQAGSSLAQLRPTAATTLRRGPLVEPARTPHVHLPSARFMSETLLYVRRAAPVLYDLESGQESAAASASDPLLRDPSGQLVATALERTCEGIAARIERAPPRGSDYASSPAISWALILPLPSPAGCSRGSARPADFGFTLLGWAPQGLVAVRGSEVRLVPLASDGRANGPPRLLAPDAPRPAPLPAGSATSDGARYVEATSHGVLVYGPSSARIELLRPDGYGAIAKEPLEAAISPSARRVAVVSAGTVYIVERN
jgi:hypothetical protein